MEWYADLLQAAMFPVLSPTQPDALQLWQFVSEGKSPDGFQRPTHSPVAQSQASGTIDNFNVVLNSQVGRIDINIFPNQTQTLESLPPQIVDMKKAYDFLASLTAKLDDQIKVARVGLVSNLSIRCENQTEVWALATEASGNVWFPEGASDIIYQINSRTKFDSAPEVVMNRVFTLTSSVMQFLDFSTVQIAFGQPIAAKSVPVVNLKIDINSATNMPIEHPVSVLVAEACAVAHAITVGGIECLK